MRWHPREVRPCYAAEIKATSIFGSKICHIFAKTPQNEGMCVDVVENKWTKNVTWGPSVDVDENKGNWEVGLLSCCVMKMRLLIRNAVIYCSAGI